MSSRFSGFTARLRAEWPCKLVMTLVLNCVFWVAYRWLSRHALFSLREVPVTWLDRAVLFQPEPWGWIYLSPFSYTTLLPWLLITRADLRRYVIGAGGMSLICFLCFFLLPTPGPRPSFTGVGPAMQFITLYDGPLNTMPSLHAGYLVYSSALAWRLFGRTLPGWVSALWVLWGVAVLYATLATKQHYALDLAAGGALGWLADAVAWRGVRAAATTPVSSGSASQAGMR